MREWNSEKKAYEMKEDMRKAEKMK